MPRVVVFATSWGPRFGGINVFNYDFCAALASEVEAKIVCAVFAATEDEKRNAALANIELVVVPRASSTEFATEDDGLLAVERLGDVSDVRLWVGHDLVTGRAALAAKKAGNGATAIIHHMDYRAYETMKGTDGAVVREKELHQQELLEAADYVCGVGPKLTKSARDKLRRKTARFEVIELRPGLYDLGALPASEAFSAITFGRLDRRADAVKLGSLAAAAYGRAARDNGLGPDPRLTVIGIDESSESTEKARLEEIVWREAKRKLPVLPLPFDTDRGRLLEHLSEHSVAMVLSIHEGFGLTAWEAISAEVPLVLTRNSGAFELIETLLGGSGLGCITPIDVKGSAGSDELNPEDIEQVSHALIQLGKDKLARETAKKNAARLKHDLSKLVSWKQMARSFAKSCEIPLKHRPMVIAVAGGHLDVELFGVSNVPRAELASHHRDARAVCEQIADDIGQMLAEAKAPPVHLNFTGVDGGTLGARIVRAYQANSGPDVTTYFHGEFSTDEEALASFDTRWPGHVAKHNVDTALPYIYQPGQVVRFSTISLRRMRLIKASEYLLCLSGHFAIEELIDAAQLKSMPIVAVGCAGGMAGKMCAEIAAYNQRLGLPEKLYTAMKHLAGAPLNRDAVRVAFSSVLDALREHCA